tara:strand:- start:106 stop:471 length:366 start_codon:yes stop_codon:yes gene_type:complete
MSHKTYKSISEVAKILNLKNPKSGKLSTHTLRYWEKEFKQIKPKIFAGNRRYYDENSINIIIKVKELLKVKGMTIKGAKKILNGENSILDETNNTSIKTKINLKNKLNKISKLIKDIKELK